MPESQIIAITRVVKPRGEYPGSFRVLFTQGDQPIKWEYVTALDELDAYRRVKSWLTPT